MQRKYGRYVLDEEKIKRSLDHSIENYPNWFEPYQRFISLNTNIWGFPKLKIQFTLCVPKKFPGDEEGVLILPWLSKLSMRVHTLLFTNTFHKEGLFILLRQVAYAEFWQRNPFWYIIWLWDKKPWRERANKRAYELLEKWYLIYRSKDV